MKEYLKNYPKLVKEYHFDRNICINFEKLTYGSGQKIWWKCDKGHEWCVSPKERVKYGCPYSEKDNIEHIIEDFTK